MLVCIHAAGAKSFGFGLDALLACNIYRASTVVLYVLTNMVFVFLCE